MKKYILFLFLYFLFSYAGAQKVILTIHQNYPVPEIPSITQAGDTLKSSSLIGNQWYKDDIMIPGATNPTLIVTNSGKYKVIITYDSGCSSDSEYFNIITGISEIKTTDFTCRIFPNPNNGIFTIELVSEKPEAFVLELFTSSGNSMFRQVVNHSSGIQQFPFGKTAIAKGIYYLHVSYSSNTVSHKVIVN